MFDRGKTFLRAVSMVVLLHVHTNNIVLTFHSITCIGPASKYDVLDAVYFKAKEREKVRIRVVYTYLGNLKLQQRRRCRRSYAIDWICPLDGRGVCLFESSHGAAVGELGGLFPLLHRLFLRGKFARAGEAGEWRL